MEKTYRRGQIYSADLNPVIGSEQGGTRPVLIISNDTGNRYSPTGEKVLQGAGTISHAQAIEKATKEYRKYQAQNLSPVEEEYLESIKNIQSIAKKKGDS